MALFQLLFASVFMGVLHHPVPHHAPVAVAGPRRWQRWSAAMAAGRSRWSPSQRPAAARAAVRGGHAYAAIIAGRHGESLLIQTAASPGTANVLTKAFTAAAAALKAPLQVRDLAPLPASDSTGISAFFLVIAGCSAGTSAPPRWA